MVGRPFPPPFGQWERAGGHNSRATIERPLSDHGRATNLDGRPIWSGDQFGRLTMQSPLTGILGILLYGHSGCLGRVRIRLC